MLYCFLLDFFHYGVLEYFLISAFILGRLEFNNFFLIKLIISLGSCICFVRVCKLFLIGL